MILATIAFVTLVGTLSGNADAIKNAPFEFETSGVEIIDYELEFNNMEIILAVEVTEPLGTIQMTFEREFFDSNYLGAEEEFTIIADGDLVYYTEIKTSLNERTLKFNLASGTTQVEIFGSQLMGLAIKDIEPKKQEPTVIFQENSEREDELLIENKQLTSENKFLKEENERLDSRIFELENLVSALQDQVSNLNALVVEQVNVIYKWVLGV